MVEDHLKLINDVQSALEYKKQEIKGNFVRQSLETREHITHTVNDIYLPDTSEFGRRSYVDFKDLTLEGTRLVDDLEKLRNVLLSKDYDTFYPPDKSSQSLFSEIEVFDRNFLKTVNSNTSQDRTLSFYINSLRKGTSLLLYLENLEGLKMGLLQDIETVQRQNQRVTLRDYFSQLSPFLFIPKADQIFAHQQDDSVDYSGRIYAIDRYDFTQGMYIQSINANGLDIGYDSNRPSYLFSIPVEQYAGDSMDLEVIAKTITHEGQDTTFSISRKFEVVTCP